MEIDIRDYLKTLPEFVFKANPGNGGDCIIASSTWQLFDSLNLRYEAPSNSLESVDLVYAGGGNLVNPTSYSARFMAAHYKTLKHLTILPHTIKNNDVLLSGFGNNVDIICRELESYRYAKAIAHKANVYLADDMAFNLDINGILAARGDLRPPSTLEYLSERYIKRHPTASWSELKQMSKHRYLFDEALKHIHHGEINCFRLDGESNRNGSYPEKNIDLSVLFTFGSITRNSADLGSSLLINLLNQCTLVNTDRLHVAITAGILGKKVNLYPGNYYKIKEIYNYSMRKKYPNVTLHDD